MNATASPVPDSSATPVPGLVAGLGCRRGVPAASVLALLDQAARAAGGAPSRLAVPDFKHDEPGLWQAASSLGLPVLRVSHEALRAQQRRCVTRSARVESRVGVLSVAEACALAAAGPGGRLVLARISRNGVTCALAAPALDAPALAAPAAAPEGGSA